MKVKSASEVVQSCPALSDSMDCSPPGSCVMQEYWSGVPLPSPYKRLERVKILADWMKKIQVYVAITDVSKIKEQKLVESKWIEKYIPG